MERKTLPHQSISPRKILENVTILMLVTFLLGIGALYSSEMQSGAPGKPAETEAGCTGNELLQLLHQSFVKPYTSAWEKIAPCTTDLLSNFYFVIHPLHIPGGMVSIAYP